MQDAQGRVLLRVIDGGKKGQVHAHKDNSEWSWNHYEGTTLPSESTKVEIPLCPELGIQYDVVSNRVEAYFLCQKVQQKIINGFNKAEVNTVRWSASVVYRSAIYPAQCPSQCSAVSSIMSIPLVRFFLVAQSQWDDSEELPQFVQKMLQPEPTRKSQVRKSRSFKESSPSETDSSIDTLNSNLMQLTANIKRLLAEPIWSDNAQGIPVNQNWYTDLHNYLVWQWAACGKQKGPSKELKNYIAAPNDFSVEINCVVSPEKMQLLFKLMKASYYVMLSIYFVYLLMLSFIS